MSAFVFHENGGPLSISVLDKRWAKARKLAGRPDVIFHDLRAGVRCVYSYAAVCENESRWT